QMKVFAALLGPSHNDVLARFDAPLSKLTPARVFGAAMANAIVTGKLDVKPVSEADFAKLLPVVVSPGPGVNPEAKTRAQAALGQLGPEVSAMIDRTLSRWIEEWGAAFLQGGSFDPKLVLALPIEGVKTL